MGKVENEIFICECGNIEHQLVASYFEDDDDGYVYLTVHLPNQGFFRRLICGIKYIFGYKCRYGFFDEFIFNKNDADRLQKVVDYLKR